MIELIFSGSTFDQKRLAKAGGHIALKPNGTVVFQFRTKTQFNQYVQLGKKKGATA